MEYLRIPDLTYPNVCARHKCRIHKHFLMNVNSSPAIFGQVKCVRRGFNVPMRINLDLNKKRHDIVGPDVLFLSKTTRCNDTYLHYQSNVFEQ